MVGWENRCEANVYFYDLDLGSHLERATSFDWLLRKQESKRAREREREREKEGDFGLNKIGAGRNNWL